MGVLVVCTCFAGAGIMGLGCGGTNRYRADGGGPTPLGGGGAPGPGTLNPGISTSDDAATIPAPDMPWTEGVTVHLEQVLQVQTAFASFGLPIPHGKVADATKVRVLAHGGTSPIAGVNVSVLLREHDAEGNATGVRALLVQIPTTGLAASSDVDVVWAGTGSAPGTTTLPFTQVSGASAETVDTAERTIVKNGSTCSLVETATATKTLFTGVEPVYLATYPDGYLASTSIIGKQWSRSQVAGSAAMGGVKYMSDYAGLFGLSAIYKESYRLNPDPDSVVEPLAKDNYEGWLYDRCTTFLSFYVHTGDVRFLRSAHRNCSYYASVIDANGIFTGKPDPDSKYSHLRGLYAYYALTGSEAAMTAGKAIAEMWLKDTSFVAPYRAGHLRGQDKLWTERLLGTSMEGLYYGHRLLGDKQYLTAFKEMFKTAYTHVTTTDQKTLDAINLQDGSAKYPSFPPQNCFIHNGAQAAESDGTTPWCSGWMTELLVDALLAYQQQTDDARVDEIFLRLARFLRDVGSSYLTGDIAQDNFMSPQNCYDSSRGFEARRLVPLYGAGLTSGGKRSFGGEYDDYNHCSDATALVAAALRSLKRLGGYDAGGPIGPFATEGQSLLQLFHEISNCAQAAFVSFTRKARDPANQTSSGLCTGLSDPKTYIKNNKIGYPTYAIGPQRKLSWWFNMPLLQFGLLQEAGVAVPELHPGAIQPAGKTCP